MMQENVRHKCIVKAYEHLRSIGKVHTKTDVANIMHASRSNVTAALNGDSKFLTDNFLERFNVAFGNTFNIKWLMTGEGDMLSSTSSAQPQPSVKNERVADDEAYKVPLVPISALGGSLNDFNLAVKRDDCETVISPIKDIDMAIKISGADDPNKVLCESINPKYPPFEVSLEHVYGVYIVMMCMSFK